MVFFLSLGWVSFRHSEGYLNELFFCDATITIKYAAHTYHRYGHDGSDNQNKIHNEDCRHPHLGFMNCVFFNCNLFYHPDMFRMDTFVGNIIVDCKWTNCISGIKIKRAADLPFDLTSHNHVVHDNCYKHPWWDYDSKTIGEIDMKKKLQF